MTSDRDEIEDCISTLMQMANLHSNPEFISLWNRRAALIRRIEKERSVLDDENHRLYQRIEELEKERDEARAELSACEMAFRLGEQALLEARNKALDEVMVALLNLPIHHTGRISTKSAVDAILALKSQEPTT